MNINDRLKIEPIESKDATSYAEFIGRLTLTSGVEDTPIFCVYSRRTPFDVEKKAAGLSKHLHYELGIHGWERAWGAFYKSPRGVYELVGSLILSTDRLAESQMHRCILGMGIKLEYRHLGMGEALVKHVIEWAKLQKFLSWIDLSVFGDNWPARKLYKKLGFIEVGRLVDAYRVDGNSIDDIQMSLELSQLR